MATDTTYQGWTNYETWNVALWISNEEGSYRYWKEVTEEMIRNEIKVEGDDSDANEVKEGIVRGMANVLRSEITENIDEQAQGLHGMASDLLTSAVQEVNWHEIAASLVEDYYDDVVQELREDAEDDNEDETEENEINDGDYVLSVTGTLGTSYSVSVHQGKRLGTFSTWNEVTDAIKADMEQEQFWPGVWYINDHGNIESINVNE